MILNLAHITAPTKSQSWKTRRLNRLVGAAFRVCIYADPTSSKTFGMDTRISPNGGVYLVTIKFHDEWTQGDIERFVKLAKGVDIFHDIFFHKAIDSSVTI